MLVGRTEGAHYFISPYYALNTHTNPWAPTQPMEKVLWAESPLSRPKNQISAKRCLLARAHSDAAEEQVLPRCSLPALPEPRESPSQEPRLAKGRFMVHRDYIK